LWNSPVYGAKTQYIEEPEDSPPLSPNYATGLQKLGGKLLYNVRALDPTLTMPVNVLASEQTKATAETIIKLLNYCTTYSEAKVRYNASDMIWCIISLQKKSKSREGVFCYMGSNIDNANRLTNGALLIISTILKHGISSATETEAEIRPMQRSQQSYVQHWKEGGHTRPPTPLKTYNTIATCYSNGTIKKKRTMAIDMWSYWVKDRVKQGQFHVYWDPGYQNLVDYFTKHHSPAHHNTARNIHTREWTTA
jgi:hypothetical protein